MDQVGNSVALASTGMKPELKPPALATQGLSKLDWVTVWFFWWL